MVSIGPTVSEKSFKYFPIGSNFRIISADGSHLGWQAGSSDTILKGDYSRTIPLSSFREDVPIEPNVETMSAEGGHLGWRAGSSDTTLKGDHLRTSPTNFGPNWPSSFREDF